MEDNTGLWPIPRSTLVEMVKYAKGLPSYNDTQHIVDFLNQQFRGVSNEEAFSLIDSIQAYFKEKNEIIVKEETKRQTKRYLDNFFGKPLIDVSDDQISASILKLSAHMNSKRDWAAIYIILKDFCGWPEKKVSFEKRVKQLDLNGLPNNKSFDYTAMRQGFGYHWPRTYDGWLTYNEGDDTFVHRKDVATTFLRILRENASI